MNGILFYRNIMVIIIIDIYVNILLKVCELFFF